MTRRRFFTLDVFTDTRFAGNPLAVVLDGDGLDASGMLAIAREFNLSETVFVLPPADASHRARVRIFTPARELPFAGHPTVGTAVLLSIIDGPGGPSELVLEEEVGPVRCRVRPTAADAGHAEFALPRLPVRERLDVDRGAMAGALGLETTDLETGDWPIDRWSAGNPFTFVAAAGAGAVGRCRVNLSTFEEVFRGTGTAAVFVFSRETTGAGRDFHARMFAPGFGMIEDPATGSAVAAFAGYLAAYGRCSDGEHLVRVEQGIEMGRPSVIDLRMTLSHGQLASASVGGGAICVSEGTLR